MDLAISRILVPIDFSPHSEVALRYGTALASRVEASVDLLHVVEDPVATGAWSSAIAIPNLSELREQLIDEAARRLERYRAPAAGARVPMRTAVRAGPPAHTITEYATTLGIDLIVMGRHGRSGLAHLVMGSVAERVLRHAPCPVLTLRSDVIGDRTESALAVMEPAALGFALGHLGASRE